MPADSSTAPARLADGERGARVLAEEEVLDRERGRLVARDQVADARVDAREPALERLVGAGPDHAAVERRELLPAREDHPKAGMGGAGIDAEDDHHPSDSARGGGRLLTKYLAARGRGAGLGRRGPARRDSTAKDREARIAILRDLHADGVPLDELRTAVRRGAADVPAGRARAARGAALQRARRSRRRAGLDFDFLTRQWQALGLAGRDPDDGRLRRARPRGREAHQAVPRRRRAAGRHHRHGARARPVAGARRRGLAVSDRHSASSGPDSTEYDVAQQAQVARPLADLMEPTLAYVFGLQLVDQLRHEVDRPRGHRRRGSAR